jgi:hypothetical protein
MLKYKTQRVVRCSDFDKLVRETYGKIYCFQQQEGCRDRGQYGFAVPDKWADDFENDEIPIQVNGEEMGVSFKSWLAVNDNFYSNTFHERLFWERNFYPSFEVLVNDLYEKGLIEAGDYVLDVDW